MRMLHWHEPRGTGGLEMLKHVILKFNFFI